LWLETTLVLGTGYGYRLNLRQIGAKKLETAGKMAKNEEGLSQFIIYVHEKIVGFFTNIITSK